MRPWRSVCFAFCYLVVISLRKAQGFNSRRRRTAAATDAAQHLVTDLPGLATGTFATKHFAGLVPVTGGELFYWLFEAASNTSHAPLVVWLNGGPGCSSMDGLFLEHGPFKLSGGSVSINTHRCALRTPFVAALACLSHSKSLQCLIWRQSSVHTAPHFTLCSWQTVANMLYVDQPVGTGLSFTTVDDYADDEAEVDTQFYLFLQNFFKLHTTYADRDLYFSGESHAGEHRVTQ